MQVRPIDKMLRIIEQVADSRGETIEDRSEYKGICKILTDFDMGEKPNSDDKLWAAENLRMLFASYGLSYDYYMHKCVWEL